MKNKLLFSLIPLQILVIVFFVKIQNILLDSGFSWTLSKISPYVILGITGFIIGFLLFKATRNLKKLLRFLVIPISVVAGFAIGFALHPIYAGDYNRSGKIPAAQTTLADAKGDLVMVALPDCPFCHGAVSLLNKLQERNPQLKISILVTGKDPQTLLSFRNEADKRIIIRHPKNQEKLLAVSGYHFPTFLQVKNGKVMEVWTNEELGFPALDHLESLTK